MEPNRPEPLDPRGVVVRPLREEDLADADRIFRLAFGTFLGLPDPTRFAGDADLIRPRWSSSPESAFGAEVAGELVATNLATRWGSVGFFGPLTVDPKYWEQGVAKRLMEPVVACFDSWDLALAGLFTFAQSAKHVALYQKFGFWPRFLTAVMARPVGTGGMAGEWSRLSELSTSRREETIAEVARLTDAVFSGLDLSAEIRAVGEQRLGDTLLVWGDDGLAAVAICHWGAGTEGGSGTCYMKFAATRPGPGAPAAFDRLLAASDALASSAGLGSVVAGTNAGRERAWRAMTSAGFRIVIQGVAMHRDNVEGYSRPDVYAIDDWR